MASSSSVSSLRVASKQPELAYNQKVLRQMSELRHGLALKIEEDEAHIHRLTVLHREFSRESRLLEAIAEAYEAQGVSKKCDMSYVTARCLSLRERLVGNAGELDRASGLLVKEQQRQRELREQARQHASVVRETVALLSSYHNEVSESLAAKRESVTLEKQCLVQGATNGPELIGPTEIDARARVSPSKLPLSPGMQRRNSFVGDSSTSLPVSHGSVMDRPGSSPPVSPSQRASFGIGFSPYQSPYTPPPLIPGKPRTARARSHNSSPSRHPSGSLNRPTGSSRSGSPIPSSMAQLNQQTSELAYRLLEQRFSAGEQLTNEELNQLQMGRAQNAAGARAQPAAPAAPPQLSQCSSNGTKRLGEEVPLARPNFTTDMQLSDNEPTKRTDDASPPVSPASHRRQSITDKKLDTAEGALHRSRAWRVDMQAKLSEIECEARNDFVATTAALKATIRDTKHELSQVKSRRLYVEQRRTKVTSVRRRLQVSLQEKQVPLATLLRNLETLSKRRLVAQDDTTEEFVRHQLAEMQGIVNAIDAELLSAEVEIQTLDQNHKELCKAESELSQLLILDSQCLRIRQDHKMKPMKTVAAAIR